MKKSATTLTRAISTLLREIGENPKREGLRDTPSRVARMYAEFTDGYEQRPQTILSRVFPGEGHDQMVLVRRIAFVSMCEHHLLPFEGIAHVAYIPDRKVVGLSKIPRLVDCFAHRLQLQERLTDQIADAMMAHLHPAGCGVVICAQHACLRCRGARKPDADMVTSALRGCFREAEAKSEFLKLIDLGRAR